MTAEAVAPLNILSATDIADPAEFATIGAVILAAESVQDAVLTIVRDGDFIDPRCKFAIGVVRRMRSENLPVDPITLCGYVIRNGMLTGAPRVNLASFLAEVASAVPVPASAPWYADQVGESAARRAAQFAGRRIAAAAECDSLADLATIIAEELISVTAAISRVGSVAK